ncbi:MAG: transposase [Ferruginibacter sp.]|nr:transposase [Ferruginibacter sp.]
MKKDETGVSFGDSLHQPELFWRNIKYENIYLHAYENGVTLYKGVNDYMQFYNWKRRHQSLEYKTPEVLYKQTMTA